MRRPTQKLRSNDIPAFAHSPHRLRHKRQSLTSGQIQGLRRLRAIRSIGSGLKRSRLGKPKRPIIKGGGTHTPNIFLFFKFQLQRIGRINLRFRPWKGQIWITPLFRIFFIFRGSIAFASTIDIDWILRNNDYFKYRWNFCPLVRISIQLPTSSTPMK